MNKTIKKIETLSGSDIDQFYTIGSWNNNETIGIVANKKNFRLRVEELNKINDILRFKINLASNSNDGRRTNNYLEILESETTPPNTLNSYQNKE